MINLAIGENSPEICNAIIEIPRGGTIKYEVDKATGLIKVDRYMRSAVHYPENYGFFPGTLADDGDPLDVFVLGEPTYPGVLIEVRVIGVIDMVDGGTKDEKVIGVPKNHHGYTHVNDIEDLGKNTVDRMTDFLRTYKFLEGKKVEILGVKGKAFAQELIKKFTINK